MKTIGRLIPATLLISALIMSCTSGQNSINWISGTWVMRDSVMTVGESWTENSDHEHNGRSFIVSKQDTSLYETVLLSKKSGRWQYIVTAVGQNNSQPVAFDLTSSDGHQYVFENPRHDYPKRIIYRLINNDSVHASVDGGAGIKEEHFYFKKATSP